MNIQQFIEKHIETNYPDASDKEKTIIRTAVHLGYEFAKSNENPTPEETYTKADLVSFGNYLLSPERENMVSEINKREVTHADLENWRDLIVNR